MIVLEPKSVAVKSVKHTQPTALPPVSKVPRKTQRDTSCTGQTVLPPIFKGSQKTQPGFSLHQQTVLPQIHKNGQKPSHQRAVQVCPTSVEWYISALYFREMFSICGLDPVSSKRTVCWGEKPSLWKPLIPRRGRKWSRRPLSKEQPCLLKVRTLWIMFENPCYSVVSFWEQDKYLWMICFLCVQVFWETPSCIWQSMSWQRSRTTNRCGTWEKPPTGLVPQRSLRPRIQSPSTVAMTPRRDFTKWQSMTIWPTALRFWGRLVQATLDKSSNAWTTRPKSWWPWRWFEAKTGKTLSNCQSLTDDDSHLSLSVESRSHQTN